MEKRDKNVINLFLKEDRVTYSVVIGSRGESGEFGCKERYRQTKVEEFLSDVCKRYFGDEDICDLEMAIFKICSEDIHIYVDNKLFNLDSKRDDNLRIKTPKEIVHDRKISLQLKDLFTKVLNIQFSGGKDD